MRRGGRRGQRRSWLIVAVVLTAIFLAAVFEDQSSQNQTSGVRAAIVDQLSLTYRDESFVGSVTTTLELAGYKVDYYPGEAATVDFYRSLPELGYGLLILRAHSSDHSSGNLLALFTSEVYSTTKYLPEQLVGQVGRVWYGKVGEGTPYFGVNQEFVRQGMKGRFQNTLVIMMGCNGLSYTDAMARAFVEKGAKIYIGWSGSVLGSHTDLATTHLVQHLLEEGKTVGEAIAETMVEVGPDPLYNSKLIYYPSSS